MLATITTSFQTLKTLKSLRYFTTVWYWQEARGKLTLPNHCEFVLLETFQCYFPCCNIPGILKLTSYVSIKEGVQGTGDSYSTCLYSAIAKPDMTIKAKKLSIKLKYKICTVSFFFQKKYCKIIYWLLCQMEMVRSIKFYAEGSMFSVAIAT